MAISSSTKRIGLLVPSSNTVMEVDFYSHAPVGVSIHTARMNMESTTPEGEARMLDEFTLPAAHDLATARPHAVVFGCTSAGALRGNEYDDLLCKQISEITGVITVSVIRAVREILQANGVRRVIVLTPYIDALNQRIKASLEADGLEVLKISGLDITENFTIAQVPTEKIVQSACQAFEGFKPDAVFVSCTNFPAMKALPVLQRALPVPVFTSNQAALSMALRSIGY